MFQSGAFVPKREERRREQLPLGCSLLVSHKLVAALACRLVDRMQLVLSGQTRTSLDPKGGLCAPKGRLDGVYGEGNGNR